VFDTKGVNAHLAVTLQKFGVEVTGKVWFSWSMQCEGLPTNVKMVTGEPFGPTRAGAAEGPPM